MHLVILQDLKQMLEQNARRFIGLTNRKYNLLADEYTFIIEPSSNIFTIHDKKNRSNM